MGKKIDRIFYRIRELVIPSLIVPYLKEVLEKKASTLKRIDHYILNEVLESQTIKLREEMRREKMLSLSTDSNYVRISFKDGRFTILTPDDDDDDNYFY